MVPAIEDKTNFIIDQFFEDGKCEVASQIAQPLPREGNIGRSQTKRLVRISNTGDCKDPLNYKCYKYKEEEEDRYIGSYVRSGLRRGLEIEKKIGTNPFKFGLIGSTDNHTALAASEEDNFFGKFSDSEPGPGRVDSCMAYGNFCFSCSGS